jgi:hypothetical protein
MVSNPHRLAELRSRAAHLEIAKRIGSDASIAPAALARLERDYARGITSRHYYERWRSLLLGPQSQLIERIGGCDEDAASLRQASPLSGVLQPKERWALWEEVRRVFEAETTGGVAELPSQ